MSRRKDPFWDYVEKLDDGLFKCAFCGFKFAAGISVSRIKWHLSGVKGRGVKICERVPQEVQDAARAAIDCPPEKKLKSIASSSNNEVTNATSTYVLQHSSQVRHVEMSEQGEALSPGALARMDSIHVKDIELTPDVPETRRRTEQGEALSPGVLAWIDSITVQDIELMLDAPETRPRTEQGEALSPGALAWIDSISVQDIELTVDAPETRPRTEQGGALSPEALVWMDRFTVLNGSNLQFIERTEQGGAISPGLERRLNLRHVPSFKWLRELKSLDLSRVSLEILPGRIFSLSNLMYLRLDGCSLNEFPSGILPKLSHLEILIIEGKMGGKYGNGRHASLTVKGNELACLSKLKILKCHFEYVSDFVEYIKSRGETQSQSTYQITVGQLDKYDYRRMTDKFRRNRSVGLGQLCIDRDGDFQVMLPNDIEELLICKFNDAIRSICEVSSLMKYSTELEVIRIWDCNSMESLVSSSGFRSSPPPSPSSNGIFSSLKEFHCYNCRGMKNILPFVLLPNLVNLEVIEVKYCEEMEEIIARRDEESVIGEEFSLTKLRCLRLEDLPELKSICSAKLICDSLQAIEVRECGKLKRMPICLPLLDNDSGQPSPPPALRRISIYPKEWWETIVEWDNPNTKDVLLPFVEFL